TNFFFQAEDGIRDFHVTGVQTCALPILEVMPWVFAVFGVGMFIGNLLGAWAADRVGFPAAGGLLLWSAAALALYPFAASNLWAQIGRASCRERVAVPGVVVAWTETGKSR